MREEPPISMRETNFRSAGTPEMDRWCRVRKEVGTCWTEKKGRERVEGCAVSSPEATKTILGKERKGG